MKIVYHQGGKQEIREGDRFIPGLMVKLHTANKKGTQFRVHLKDQPATPITFEALQKLVAQYKSTGEELHIHAVQEEVKQRALQDAEVKIKVAVYVPAHGSGELGALVTDLKSNVTASINDGAQIFLTNEYFFTRAGGKAFSAADKQKLDTQLLTLSSHHPDVLIIAGTILWFNDKTNKLTNTALVLYKGSLTGYRKHNMVSDTVLGQNEKSLQDRKVEYRLDNGALPQLDLLVAGLSCRIQICSDVRPLQPKDFDLQLITASGFGTLNSQSHEGGWTFVADRVEGIWVHQGGVDQGADGTQERKPEFLGKSGCHVIEKRVRPLAQPPKRVLQDLRRPSPGLKT